MRCVRQILDDLYYIGASDRRLALFENVYPIPKGVSYNSYILMDEKTVLLDTVDKSVFEQFFENLEYVLNGKPLDYLVVNHMEPDHCATIQETVLRHPEVKIVCNAKTVTMIKQYFTFDIDSRVVVVKEGATLETGKHTLTFVMAPMVHWPEVMVTYDITTKTLFSADAFGTFGALNGNIYADEVNFETEYLPEARRYYCNIVGKYGPQVQALLRKAATIDIAMICPLHGPIWRKDIGWFVEKYVNWSTYMPEENAVMIAYASVYGHTENAVEILAALLAEKGVRNVKLYEVSHTHPSEIIAEAFRCSHFVFASTTYNAGLFVTMETLINDLSAHNIQNRTVALIENGTWAPMSGSIMKFTLSQLKNMTFIDDTLTLKSSLKDAQMAQLEALADAIVRSMKPVAAPAASVEVNEAKIDKTCMFKLSYGLFVLTAKGEKDNGCIINTVTQLTDTPKRISIAVNKANYTHDLIKKTGVFNVSVLNNDATFDTFKHFGFQSGRDTDKFADYADIERSENGLIYLTKGTNAFLSAKVIDAQDWGTHTLFIAEVTEGKTLNNVPSLTYAYYFDHVKPKPQKLSEPKGWVCKICGYVYEGDDLPEDFICPLCKHGAEDFEKA